jgi:predicted transcriptional regulator
MKNDVYSNCLREDLKIWKKQVGASYDDIAYLLKCSKSHIYEFIKRKKALSYELGRSVEYLIMNFDTVCFANYKAEKILSKKELKDD